MLLLGRTGQRVQGISVLFLKTTCESTIISKKIPIKKKKQPIKEICGARSKDGGFLWGQRDNWLRRYD